MTESTEREAIHPSHEMDEWYSTIVTLTETTRFGSIRKCKLCGAEQAKTAAGSAMFDELKVQCPDARAAAPQAQPSDYVRAPADLGPPGSEVWIRADSDCAQLLPPQAQPAPAGCDEISKYWQHWDGDKWVGPR